MKVEPTLKNGASNLLYASQKTCKVEKLETKRKPINVSVITDPFPRKASKHSVAQASNDTGEISFTSLIKAIYRHVNDKKSSFYEQRYMERLNLPQAAKSSKAEQVL